MFFPSNDGKGDIVDVFLLVLLLAVNVAIATWNAVVVGKVWDLARGGLNKLLLISALTQSAVGYSGLVLVVVLVGGHAIGSLDDEAIQVASSLWYLLIVVPAIGTGFVIWIHSVIHFLKKPSVGGGLVAGWNSFAQARNMINAMSAVPRAWESVSNGLSKLKGAALLVALSLGIGVLATYVVFAWSRASARVALREGTY